MQVSRECCRKKVMEKSRGERALIRGPQNRRSIRSRKLVVLIVDKRQFYSGKSEFLSPN